MGYSASQECEPRSSQSVVVMYFVEKREEIVRLYMGLYRLIPRTDKFHSIAMYRFLYINYILMTI